MEAKKVTYAKAQLIRHPILCFLRPASKTGFMRVKKYGPKPNRMKDRPFFHNTLASMAPNEAPSCKRLPIHASSGRLTAISFIGLTGSIMKRLCLFYLSFKRSFLKKEEQKL